MAIPKINSIHPAEDAVLLICDAPLSLEELERGADEEDLRSVEHIQAAERRRERLMWRRVLREHFGQSICVEYSEDGAPEIKNFPYKHISVSHCRGVVAVVASQRVCGVDVERTFRNFERIASRYVSEREWVLREQRGCDRQMFLAAVWSAKECMYKLARRTRLDLRRDLKIEDLDLKGGTVVGCVAGLGSVRMHIEQGDGYLVVYSY